jgi:hypothetical protein
LMDGYFKGDWYPKYSGGHLETVWCLTCLLFFLLIWRSPSPNSEFRTPISKKLRFSSGDHNSKNGMFARLTRSYSDSDSIRIVIIIIIIIILINLLNTINIHFFFFF